MRHIASGNEHPSIRQILESLGEPSSPPPLAPTRAPPLWGMTETEPGTSDQWAPQFDPQAQPVPDCEFDQLVAW